MLGLSFKHGDNMSDSVDLFEMRRLETLSNTIFGVAMTLLAYNLPKGQIPNGVPIWSTIWAAYQSQIIAVTGWQRHSVRGFLAGVVRKKLGLNLVSDQTDKGRLYRIKEGRASLAVVNRAQQTA
jgi:hypothetical protein